MSSSPPTSPRLRRAATPPAAIPHNAATPSATATATSTPAEEGRQPAIPQPTDTDTFRDAVAAEVAGSAAKGKLQEAEWRGEQSVEGVEGELGDGEEEDG